MATESPLRLIGSSGSGNWPSKDTASYTSSTTNIAAQELGLLLQEQNIHMNRESSAPNRSGSAPPSVEGSSLAIGELRRQRNLNLKGIVENLHNAIEYCETEEQLRSDPAYIVYYHSNVNLNPRLPQPIISRESRRLVHHIGSFGESWKMPSFDGDSKKTVLSPHKEDSEDDQSPGTESHSSFVSGKYASPLQARQKSLLDLIQEDPPWTPSPVYTIPSHDCHQSSLGSKEPEEFGTSVSLQSSPSSTQKGIPNNDNNVKKDTIPSVVTRDIVNEIKTVGISDDQHDDKFQQYAYQCPMQSMPHSPVSSNRNCQSMPSSYNIMDHFSSMQLKQPSSEVHPASLMPDGVTPAFYATADTYGSPYHSNMQPTNVFPPQAQFALGGYALNTSLLPPYVTGYSPYNALPMSVEIPTSPNFGAIRPGTLPIDMHNLYKYYGELSFQDPMYMSYLPHSSLVSYPSMGNNPIESPPSTFDQTAPDHRAQTTRTRSFNIPSSSKGGTGSPQYAANPRNISVMMPYPTTPLGSPVFQGSSMASSSFSGRRNESMPFSINSPRAAGCAYSTWQGQRGRDKPNDKKPPTILEELKSSKSHKCELTDITGRVVDFSADQHGSRFIQQKLETCNAEEKGSVFQEILPHASTLMTDVFGNYVIQKFFEYGNHEQRKELANKLVGQILPLSLQMYGCRVIQKALEVIDLDQKTRLVRELDGHVMRCVRDQNGNHVIQKCIECVPTDKIDFIISAFRHNVASLSMHPYGCRVIQRVLEHCTDEKQSQCIVDEILQSTCSLAQDQYGNYVTQHVLERGKPFERSQIIKKIAGQVVQMSQHKFASNVIEKCLEHGNASERDLLIEEIVGQTEGNDNLLVMMKDQFANYVVQKILEICSDRQREILLGRMRVHLQALRKYTYGKHIVARVEQLCGEEPCPSE